ncbi:hypothetical protein EDB19DRAFT_365441 [Suillus lakei]|nr:hypothetical protein EDB19DRAFT_365441 [Suillus lakei]
MTTSKDGVWALAGRNRKDSCAVVHTCMLLTGKKKFRLPRTGYTKRNKLSSTVYLYHIQVIAGDGVVGPASINLPPRTIVIWSHNERIVIFLVLIIVGYWSVILQDILLTAVWVPDTGRQITHNNATVLAVTLFVRCLLTLCFSTYKFA